MRRYLVVGFVIAIVVLLLDILTKAYTYHMVSPIAKNLWSYPWGGIGLFDGKWIQFAWVHATNKGAAWGSLDSYQIPLLFIRITLVTALIIYLFAFNRRWTYVIPIFLLVAGATGNVIDYFFYGEVIDMFKGVFWGYHYPVFNVADSAITVGVVWLFIASFLKKDE